MNRKADARRISRHIIIALKMAKPGDLPYRLYEWATKEMQFRPPPSCPRMPTIENFRTLTMGGNNAKVWKYVIENVASTKKLSKIRGNLSLCEEEQQLITLNEENEMKKKKIEKLKQEIRYLETDGKQLEEELFESDATLSDAYTELFNLKKKSVLLSQFSAQSKKQMSVFNCLQQQISEKLADSQNVSDKEARLYYCVNSSNKTETSCQKNVRENIEKIYKDLLDMHQNNQALKKYEDQASNGSTPNQILQQNVDQQILESQKSHIMKDINTKNLQTQNQKDKLQVEEMLKVANALLQEILDDDPQKMSMAKDLLQREVQAAGLEASMSCLEKETCRLREELLKGDGEKKLLEKKQERIENMQTLIQKKSDLIQDLYEDFYSSKSELDNGHIQMVNFVKEKLVPHKESVRHFEGDLKNVVTDEVTKFLDASLPHLMTVDVNGCKIPRTELSINQLNPDFVLNSENCLRGILRAVDFPMFKAPEHILAHISQLKANIMKNQLIQNLATDATSNQSDSGNEVEIIEKLEKLFEMLNQSEHEIQTSIHQNLKQNLKKVVSDINSLSVLKRRIEEWETQPAQHAVPWVKVNGSTFDQWMERWKVAVAQLRQYQVADLC
ncbi:HAUS augmin-like complex subunit 5 isoform X1 [Octopus vulgaris]|uniref:HAUS augmin-like complex subunit 5 isoform X1 n=1 Tax=Octopus vulgaris TaxID=6645 RepID=A0AA36BMQ7_OCTVU|nr:HAUS augmin-like complex subunit 5 isoform X1 [Octopus vulgaris]